MRIAISGASGLVGAALAESLRRSGDTIVPLVRATPRTATEPRDVIRWDPVADTIDSAAMEGLDAVVHLAGENIAGGRWNAERKRRILESRTKGTRLMAETIARLARPPRVFLSASAIGYYGDRGDEVLTEDSPPGGGFLADVCQAWEAATTPLDGTAIRLVKMRIGVVLCAEGGALRSMMGVFRLGLGGILGSGKQYFSWIEMDDLVRAIQELLRLESCAGVYNLTAPNPVTNREFTRSLGRAIRRPTLLPFPRFAARMVMGEMADELLFYSQRVLPARLLHAGFQFQHQTIDEALSFVFLERRMEREEASTRQS